MTARWPICLLAALFCIGLAEPVLGDPRADYLLHCAGCHRPDGTGLPPDVPSLVGELGRLVSIPEGRSYLVRVPGASQAPVDDAGLAEIINWILTEFNASTLPANFEPLSASEVGKARRNILADPMQYRRRFWRDTDKGY